MNILLPLEKLLRILFEFNYALTNNYGVSLMVLSIMVSTILLPIYKLADTWREREKSHQLRMKADLLVIKKKYQGQEKHYAISTCYRIYGYNPLMALRTSLGFLIQIPFFFAAYKLLSHYSAYEGVGFLGIADLSSADNLMYGINILPIIMTLCNIAAAIIYASKTHNSNDEMKGCIHLCLMAVAFLLLLYNAASGLLIYWTMNNIYALVKYTIQKRPSIDDILRTTRAVGKYILSHTYTRYIVIGVSILVGNYIYSYASHAWRNAPLAKASIDTAILLAYVLIIYLYAQLIAARNHYDYICKSKMRWTNIASIICMLASMGGVVILWNVISHDTTADSNYSSPLLSLTPNRMRQFVFASQMLCVGILFPSFIRIWNSTNNSGAGIMHMLTHHASLFQREKAHKRIYVYEGILSFFIVCMFIIVSPLSIYISEPKKISNSIYNVLPRLLILALIVFIVLMGLFIVIRKKKLLLYIVISTLSAWTIISTFYGYVLPLNTGGLIGNTFIKDAILREVSPLLIFFELSFVMICVALIIRYFRNIYKLWAFVMIGISLVGVGSTVKMLYTQRILFAGDSTLSENLLPEYHDKFMSFSKEKNILLIVLDAFPADLLPYLMDTHPETKEYFDGFTWYKNTVSIMPSTGGALPFVVGGYQFEESKQSGLERGKKAYSMWSEKLDDYSVFYYNPSANEERYSEIIPYINDNFYNNTFATIQKPDYVPYWKANKLGHEQEYDSFDKVKYFVTRPLYAFTLFRILPLAYKQKLYQDKSWGNFINPSLSIGYYLHQKNRYMSDDVVLDSFAHLSTTDSPRKTFKIYWGEATHPAFYLNQSCTLAFEEMIEGSYDVYSFDSVMNGVFCSLERVEKWFEKMKEIGVYDNTKIVIVSDHGRHTIFSEDEKKNAFVLDNEGNNIINDERLIEHRRMFALLMVKDFNERGDMNISSRLMSNADVPSILASGASEHEFSELIQDPITLSEEEASKRIMSYFGSNPPIRVHGDVYDIENWVQE